VDAGFHLHIATKALSFGRLKIRNWLFLTRIHTLNLESGTSNHGVSNSKLKSPEIFLIKIITLKNNNANFSEMSVAEGDTKF